MYYNAEVTPWFHLTPNLQYLRYPGGNNAIGDAIVAGIRAQIAF